MLTIDGIDEGTDDPLDTLVELDRLDITAPEGYRVIGPGVPLPPESVPGHRQRTRFTSMVPCAAHRCSAMALEGLPEPRRTTIEAAVFYAYVDDGLDPDVQADVWAHVTAGGLSSDVRFLVERLGAVPSAVNHIVFLRRSLATGPATGSSEANMMLVHPFAPDPSASPIKDFRATAAHEVAHLWVGYRLESKPETHWLVEGLPRMLETMRYPEAVPPLRAGVDVLVSRANAGDPYDLEKGPEDETLYQIAPYTLAQLHHAALGKGHTDAAAWEVWRTFLSDPVRPAGTRISREELRELTATGFGLAAFYPEWVREDRVGTPLLGVREFQFEAGTGVLTIDQVQTWMYGWPPFTDVPFYFGCYVPGRDDQRSFTECGATRRDVFGAPRLAPRADSHSISLSQAPGAKGAMPAYVALLGNHHLLPEATPAYGVGDGSRSVAATWLLRCNPGDEAIEAGCALDRDGDGYPAAGDCDDRDPAVHPGADELSGADPTVDFNCDGWAAGR